MLSSELPICRASVMYPRCVRRAHISCGGVVVAWRTEEMRGPRFKDLSICITVSVQGRKCSTCNGSPSISSQSDQPPPHSARSSGTHSACRPSPASSRGLVRVPLSVPKSEISQNKVSPPFLQRIGELHVRREGRQAGKEVDWGAAAREERTTRG